jgi:hypothetical protein
MRSLGLLSVIIVAVAPFIPVAAASGQKLDVKPGLWTITVVGTDSVTQVCYTADVLTGDMSQMPTAAR